MARKYKHVGEADLREEYYNFAEASDFIAELKKRYPRGLPRQNLNLLEDILWKAVLVVDAGYPDDAINDLEEILR